MTMPRGGSFSGPNPPGLVAPASWFEWIYSIYHPDKFSFPVRARNVQILVGATTSNTGNIEVIDPAFAYCIHSRGWVTASGAAPAFPYRIGFGMSSADDWFGGNDVLSSSANLTGDDISVGKIDHIFPMPREVEQGTQLTATIQNLSATPISVDVTLWYMFVRPRTNPIVRGADGSVEWARSK
jgi:hypothetical protein